ncbi:MAG: hypothetical protein B7Y76_05360, partial [Sphingobacteriia bacterium 35-40-5]
MFQFLNSGDKKNGAILHIKCLKKWTPSVLIILLLSILNLNALAQKINAKYELNIKPATSEIKIDGDVSEQAWNDAELASNFFMVQPMDTSFAKLRTDVKI